MTSKEYKIGKGWVIFMYIFAPVSIAMIGIMVVGVLDIINGRIIIPYKKLVLRTLSN